MGIKLKALLVAIIWGLVYCVAAAELELIKVLKPEQNTNATQDYYLQLLRLALEKGAAGRPVPRLQETVNLGQGRAAYELNRGTLVDVYWMGTNIQREQQLRAIRIPLDRGLLGFRRFIIRADRASLFDSITHFDQLKHYLACQGLDWPDTHIMRAAAMRVTEISSFEGLYQQVVAKRCDYLPRGYYEAGPELAERRAHYPQLIQQQTLVLHYPFTIYFFVKRDNEELAQWIEQGLEQMIDSGEFLHYMVNHPLTAHVFPLNKASAPRHIIHIPNPYLPPDTEVTNTRYWFQLADFEASEEAVH